MTTTPSKETVERMAGPRLPAHRVARFWRRVEKRGDDECWPWLGAGSLANKSGYGSVTIDGARVRATQVAWELHHGKRFPDGMFACHTCDNPPCVNPRHIWPGTSGQNYADALAKGRAFPPPAPPRSCDHPRTGDNARMHQGRAICRQCHNASTRARYHFLKNERLAAYRAGKEARS